MLIPKFERPIHLDYGHYSKDGMIGAVYYRHDSLFWIPNKTIEPHILNSWLYRNDYRSLEDYVFYSQDFADQILEKDINLYFEISGIDRSSELGKKLIAEHTKRRILN